MTTFFTRLNLSGPFGNVIDQYTIPGAHGNGQGRATSVQIGYQDGRQRERWIVSCAVTNHAKPSLNDHHSSIFLRLKGLL